MSLCGLHVRRFSHDADIIETRSSIRLPPDPVRVVRLASENSGAEARPCIIHRQGWQSATASTVHTAVLCLCPSPAKLAKQAAWRRVLRRIWPVDIFPGSLSTPNPSACPRTRGQLPPWFRRLHQPSDLDGTVRTSRTVLLVGASSNMFPRKPTPPTKPTSTTLLRGVGRHGLSVPLTTTYETWV
jgi:hypothetical protein